MLSRKIFFGVVAWISILFIPAAEVRAQELHDIGLQGGASTYLGDFNSSNIFYAPSPFMGVHFRYNLSSYNNFRISLNVGQLRGSSSNYTDYLPNIGDGIDFKEQFFNLDLKYEVNFLPFDILNTRSSLFAPYLLLGIGVYAYGGSPLFAIPFGGGVKVAAAKRLTVGLEVQLAKTFTDDLDSYVNVSDSRSLIHNNDWFFTCGLVISYRLKLGQKECPVYL